MRIMYSELKEPLMIYHYSEFITITMAAKNIGITRQGVMKAINSGRIDGYKIGEIWLLKLVDVDKFRYERRSP